MREIKFRAWDKEMNQMTDVKSFHFHQWYVDTDLSAERNSFKNEETDRHILMQFTGLKDKVGKEIYEGDIITYKYLATNDEERKQTKGEIVFREGCFKIDGFKINAQIWGIIIYWQEPDWENCEVIGNIYEEELGI